MLKKAFLIASFLFLLFGLFGLFKLVQLMSLIAETTADVSGPIAISGQIKVGFFISMLPALGIAFSLLAKSDSKKWALVLLVLNSLILLLAVLAPFLVLYFGLF